MRKLACFGIILSLFQFDLLNAQVGRGTYGNPHIHNAGVSDVKVTIGNFCSIAANVNMLLGMEHRPDWVTTYPFNVLWPTVAGHIAGNPASKVISLLEMMFGLL